MDVLTQRNEENLKTNSDTITESCQKMSNTLEDLGSFYKGSKIFITGGTGNTKIIYYKPNTINSN